MTIGAECQGMNKQRGGEGVASMIPSWRPEKNDAWRNANGKQKEKGQAVEKEMKNVT